MRRSPISVPASSPAPISIAGFGLANASNMTDQRLLDGLHRDAWAPGAPVDPSCIMPLVACLQGLRSRCNQEAWDGLLDAWITAAHQEPSPTSGITPEVGRAQRVLMAMVEAEPDGGTAAATFLRISDRLTTQQISGSVAFLATFTGHHVVQRMVDDQLVDVPTLDRIAGVIGHMCSVSSDRWAGVLVDRVVAQMGSRLDLHADADMLEVAKTSAVSPAAMHACHMIRQVSQYDLQARRRTGWAEAPIHAQVSIIQADADWCRRTVGYALGVMMQNVLPPHQYDAARRILACFGQGEQVPSQAGSVGMDKPAMH